MAAAPALTMHDDRTIADLALFPDDGRRRELSHGRIVEWDVTNYEHGSLISLLTIIMGEFVRERRLGQLVGADALVKIDGDEHSARGADISFYRRERIPSDRRAPATNTPPDFAIEVLSPSDRATEVDAKVDDWLRAGVCLLWYINPQSGITTVYEGNTVRRVSADQLLDGGEVLPGLQIRLADVLRELDEIAQA